MQAKWTRPCRYFIRVCIRTDAAVILRLAAEARFLSAQLEMSLDKFWMPQ
jgi:hypothetical protein